MHDGGGVERNVVELVGGQVVCVFSDDTRANDRVCGIAIILDAVDPQGARSDAWLRPAGQAGHVCLEHGEDECQCWERVRRAGQYKDGCAGCINQDSCLPDFRLYDSDVHDGDLSLSAVSGDAGAGGVLIYD